MAKQPECKKFDGDTSSTYRIRVQGHVDSSWSELIGDMTITVDSSKGRGPVTVLVGRLLDQAALIGVLKALYDQRIPIFSVENLDEGKGE